MLLARTPVSVIAVSLSRLAVAVRVRASRVLRFPMLHGGGVAAENFEPGKRVWKTWPLRQSAQNPRGQRWIRESRQGLQDLTHPIEILAGHGKSAEAHALGMFLLTRASVRHRPVQEPNRMEKRAHEYGIRETRRR